MYRTINDNYATHSVVNIPFYMSVLLLSGKVNGKKGPCPWSTHLGGWDVRVNPSRRSNANACSDYLVWVRFSPQSGMEEQRRARVRVRASLRPPLSPPTPSLARYRLRPCSRSPAAVTAAAARDVEGELRCDGVGTRSAGTGSERTVAPARLHRPTRLCLSWVCGRRTCQLPP